VFFIYFLVPETKGKTLEQMDAVFGSSTSADDLAQLGRIQHEVGLLALIHGALPDRPGTDVEMKLPTAVETETASKVL
jgi:hypothetical protein